MSFSRKNPTYIVQLHTEKSFLNLIKSTQNQIVFTIFRLICNQTDVRVVQNQSKSGKYNLISVWLNKILKIFLYVCNLEDDLRPLSVLVFFFRNEHREVNFRFLFNQLISDCNYRFIRKSVLFNSIWEWFITRYQPINKNKYWI